MNEGEALFGGGGSILKELEEAAVKTTSGGLAGPGRHRPNRKHINRRVLGSWGVFERPADISKAFGGGKRIGVGAPEQNNVVNETKAPARRPKRLKILAREKNQADERRHRSIRREIRRTHRSRRGDRSIW